MADLISNLENNNLISDSVMSKRQNLFQSLSPHELNQCFIKIPNLPTNEVQLKNLMIYYAMALIRKFEEKAATVYGRKEIGGFCHLYIGQEAIAVGIQSCLMPQDTSITAYRCHGHMLASGANPLSILAELMGKKNGSSGGKGGSMHLFNQEKGFFGGHGIVGAQVPIGTGIGFSHKYKRDKGICVVYMGDGAANQGQVYEAFNMAALWKLPVLYIIENNKYGMGTSDVRACAGDLYKRGEPYGIKGKRIDAMDVTSVRNECDEYICAVRSTSMPHLIECVTYRYKGHSMSDPGLYRSKEEVNEKKQKDPLILLAEQIDNSDLIEKIEEFISELVEKSYEDAKNSPAPSECDLFTNVYA